MYAFALRNEFIPFWRFYSILSDYIIGFVFWFSTEKYFERNNTTSFLFLCCCPLLTLLFSSDCIHFLVKIFASTHHHTPHSFYFHFCLFTNCSSGFSIIAKCNCFQFFGFRFITISIIVILGHTMVSMVFYWGFIPRQINNSYDGWWQLSEYCQHQNHLSLDFDGNSLNFECIKKRKTKDNVQISGVKYDSPG